jgi:hypothetical protein
MLLRAALAVALGGLAVATGVFLGRRSLAAASADSRRPALVQAPAAPSVAAPFDPSQALVLELAATRESGERRTLLRVRTAPDGEFIIDEPASVLNRDASTGGVARR